MTVFSSARRKTGLSVPKASTTSPGSATSSGADHFQSASTDVFTTRNIASDVPERVGVSTATYAAAAPCLDATISSVSATLWGCPVSTSDTSFGSKLRSIDEMLRHILDRSERGALLPCIVRGVLCSTWVTFDTDYTSSSIALHHAVTND